MRRWLAVALLVVGCVSAPIATPVPAPVVTPIPERSDAEKETSIREGIIDVYGSKPQPKWYPDLRVVDGQIDLALDDTSLFVVARTAVRAAEMCRDIAFIPYDGDGRLIGFRHVHIQVGPDLVADCDIRD